MMSLKIMHKKSNELDIKLEFVQSNIEGEIVTWIQKLKKTRRDL